MDGLNKTWRAEGWSFLPAEWDKRGMFNDDDGGGPVVFLHPHSDALNDLENGWGEKEGIKDWAEIPQIYSLDV